MKWVALVPMLLMVILAGAQEWSTSTWCMDNETLVREVYRQICIAGRCDNVTRRSIEMCRWGCNIDRGECNQEPSFRWLTVAIISIIIIAIIFFLRRVL